MVAENIGYFDLTNIKAKQTRSKYLSKKETKT